MSTGRRGATPGVIRAITGQGSLASAQRTQLAICPLCDGGLRFTTGSLGETLEICDNGECPNAVPHHPIAADDGPPTLAPHEMHMHGKQNGRAAR